MRKVLLFIVPVLAFVLCFSFFYRTGTATVTAANDQASAFAGLKAQSAQAVKFGISEPLSVIAKRAGARKFDPKTARDLNKNEAPARAANGAPHDGDGASALSLGAGMPLPELSFDGMNNIDNGMAHGLLVIPPDINGDAGPNHYVQSMNILLRVYDKGGNALTPPFKMSSLFASLGTPCSTRDDGEPTALYDPMADRWLLSQYCNLQPPFRQMVAISTTGDPTGSYYVYEFVMPNYKLNDFARLGVWGNAYNMTTEQFLGSDYAGVGVFAFDRAKLLRGDASASFVYFDIPSTTGATRLGGLLPADIDGIDGPQYTTPGIFMGYTANEYGGGQQDALQLYQLTPDFANPLASVFAPMPGNPIPVAPFDPTSPAGKMDIAQPAPGEMLDSNSDRLMNRLTFRYFDGHESLTVNQTIRWSQDDQPYNAGIRYYELRRPTGQQSFSIHDQFSFGSLGTSRWIGSAALDRQGNMAIGYNMVSNDKKPAIVYTGRLASDPLSTIRNEQELIAGTGVQTAFGFRWGDYTNMTVDPADDCTFWYAGQYYTQESQDESPFGWKTRIGKFKFPECTAAPRGTIHGKVTNAVTGQPIANALVQTNSGSSRATDAQGDYRASLTPGTYGFTVSAPGYRPAAIVTDIMNGADLTQNFALEPTAVLLNGGVGVTAESCSINSAAEPGETVTVTLPLRNTGALATANLLVELLPGSGVTAPGPPQNYGAVPTGGMTFVSRPFTFTVSSALACGAPITLTFRLSDGSQDLGFINQTLNAGSPRFVMNEGFSGNGFPPGWTTSVEGEQESWRLALIEPTQNNFAAFSPEAVRIGVNALETPPVQITSPAAVLSFRNKYDLESTFLRNMLYDGGVLEIKIGGGAYQDILTAGGVFTSGGYNGPLSTCCNNPLAGRLAWSSKSGVNPNAEWINSQVKLPSAAAGQQVRFRWRVGTDVGGRREGQYIDGVNIQDGYFCSCQLTGSPAPFDFDGDGKTDPSVFHPSNDPNLSDFDYLRSSNGGAQGVSFGNAGDAAAPADFDGDGKTDVTVFRPSNNTWSILRSSDATVSIAAFGLSDDVKTPADFDGDGKADIAVYRPASGVWYVTKSSDGQFIIVQFGQSGDVPVMEDYDGDGKTDIAVWRPANGAWYVLRSSDGGFRIDPFGLNGDKPVPGDYDGDGRGDLAIFRPANGIWYIQQTGGGFTGVQFGIATDRPVQGDFDGDGKRDVAVYRASDPGVWYYLKSSDGLIGIKLFGKTGDAPVPAVYVP